MEASVSQSVLNIEFPEVLAFLFEQARYKVAYGGRGGAKSWGYAQALIIQGFQRKLRIICTREYQNSMKESVHQILSDQIDRMNLNNFYEVLQSAITGRNGTEFIFAGIKTNPRKIKSTEGIDICWVEEAEKVSKDSWQMLIPTIRKDGSEIWVSFNPDEETDPTYQRFVDNPPPGAIVKEVNWRDNPWFPEVLRKEKDYLASVDMDAYEHVWEGKCRRSSAAEIFFGKYVVDSFQPDSRYWSGPYFGADFGFARDPATLVKCWVYQDVLYIEYEFWGVGIEISDLTAKYKEIPGAETHTIRADNSRPETISHLRNNGIEKIISCAKWDGCIKDGISVLRAFKQIVIHSRCKYAIFEAKHYRYKVDELTGEVLPIIIDKHNNIWDAVRYALEPIIKRGYFAGCDLS
jgi:phage terminase large subunit